MQQAEKGAHQVRMCANVELECNGKCELSMSSAMASVSSCHHDSVSASGPVAVPITLAKAFTAEIHGHKHNTHTCSCSATQTHAQAERPRASLRMHSLTKRRDGG